MVFADINLSEQSIRGNYNPGSGGWPTVRYFNKETGYEGAPYKKRTDKAMCDELGDEQYMEDYVVDFGGVTLCNVVDKEGCSAKESKYIDKWANGKKPLEDVNKQVTRLEGMLGGKMKPSLMTWIKQRLAVLKQIVEVGDGTAPEHEEL